MAHFDVVGVDESGWEHPPFDGVIADGYLWGRGTLDTKSTLSGILFAAETHIKGGFVPENDIYFAFSGNEEIGGGGAPSIVEWFIQNGVTPALVLDEGGAVVSGVFPGVKERSALIGIAEKGMLNVEYTAKSAGGHSSAPLKDSPIGRLSRACLRMEKKPFSFRITEPAAKMFDTLARHSGFGYRIIFANLWCFAPILNLITRLNGGELSAIVRTTTAFTMAEGATGMNVIPERARMISNHRIIPSETVESLVLGIQKRISDPEIDVKVVYGMDPSRVSRTDGDEWSRVASAARECFGDIIVSPYLMLACSDSRHFSKISDHVYRFSPMELSRDERALIHASNERISVAAIERIVEFYLRLIGKC
jgi:carboxypeptidase PM20D1